MRAFDQKYWERLVKRQITEDEFGAASGAALQADNAGEKALGSQSHSPRPPRLPEYFFAGDFRPARHRALAGPAFSLRSGLGLEAQQEALQRFAEADGFAFAETFTEVEGGKHGDDHRPELAKALERARKAKAPIIVAKRAMSTTSAA
jgi:hypothetical protein